MIYYDYIEIIIHDVKKIIEFKKKFTIFVFIFAFDEILIQLICYNVCTHMMKNCHGYVQF